MSLERLQFVALRRVRYNDNRAVLTVFSRQLGTIAIVVPDGTTPAVRRQRTLLTPPGVAEGMADVRPGRELATLRGSVLPILPLSGVRRSPMKTVVSMFVAETLSGILRDAQPDRLLYDFIVQWLTELDSGASNPTAVANFLPAFLFRLTQMMGIAPDMSTRTPGAVFDMRDGIFRMTMPMHTDVLCAGDADLLCVMSDMRLDNYATVPLTGQQRRRMIDIILDYLSLHLGGKGTLTRSLDILHDVIAQ